MLKGLEIPSDLPYGVVMIDVRQPGHSHERTRTGGDRIGSVQLLKPDSSPLSDILSICKVFWSNRMVSFPPGGEAVQAAHPISSVIPSSHGAVLEVLARTETPLSARAIARLTDGRVSHTQTNAVLKALETAGIVASESRPPAYLYTLDRRHVAADPIVALASMRTVLFDRMRAAVASWDPEPAAAWLFGSFARGDATADSDVDVLLIRPDRVDEDDAAWQVQTAQFEQDVRDWSGNDCNTIEFDRQEFADLITSKERLPADVAHDGIHLFGDPLPRGAIRRGQM